MTIAFSNTILKRAFLGLLLATMASYSLGAGAGGGAASFSSRPALVAVSARGHSSLQAKIQSLWFAHKQALSEAVSDILKSEYTPYLYKSADDLAQWSNAVNPAEPFAIIDPAGKKIKVRQDDVEAFLLGMKFNIWIVNKTSILKKAMDRVDRAQDKGSELSTEKMQAILRHVASLGSASSSPAPARGAGSGAEAIVSHMPHSRDADRAAGVIHRGSQKRPIEAESASSSSSSDSNKRNRTASAERKEIAAGGAVAQPAKAEVRGAGAGAVSSSSRRALALIPPRLKIAADSAEAAIGETLAKAAAKVAKGKSLIAHDPHLFRKVGDILRRDYTRDLNNPSDDTMWTQAVKPTDAVHIIEDAHGKPITIRSDDFYAWSLKMPFEIWEVKKFTIIRKAWRLHHGQTY